MAPTRSEASAAASTCRYSASIRPVQAFPRAGRSRTTVTTPSSRLHETVFRSMSTFTATSPDPEGATAVEHQLGAGGRPGMVAQQVGDRVGDLGGGRVTPQGDLGQVLLQRSRVLEETFDGASVARHPRCDEV